MELLDKTSDFPGEETSSVVTIGVFDGVHRGHQRMISECVKLAAESGIPPVVLTFKRNPMELLAGKHPCVIAAASKKMDVLESLGVEYVVQVSFDEEFASQSPMRFCRDLLVGDLAASSVCVGENFRFGKGGKGDTSELSRLGKEFGFELKVVPMVVIDGEQLSSTLIRGLIRSGDVSKVKRCLGRPYTVRGSVIHGHERGKGLGFPTANIKMERDFCVPADGVYAGKTMLGDSTHLAAINIGDNPTFQDQENALEVYILDFKEDIYGESMEIEFHHRLREEIAFGSREELIDQMRKDVRRARNLM